MNGSNGYVSASKPWVREMDSAILRSNDESLFLNIELATAGAAAPNERCREQKRKTDCVH